MKHSILFVIYSERVSGAEITVRRLINGIKNIVEPIIVCSHGDYADELKRDGYTVVTNKGLSALRRDEQQYSVFTIGFKVLKKIFQLNYTILNLCRLKKINVIQANNLVAGSYLLPTIILFRLFAHRKKLIWFSQDMYYMDLFTGSILKYACLLFYQRVIVPSEATRSTFKFLKSKVIKLSIGLDISEIRLEAEDIVLREKLFVPSETQIVIGIFGAISARKGTHLLIESFSSLAREYSHLRLLILGDFKFAKNEYRTMFLNRIQELNKEVYCVKEWATNVYDYYASIDILVNATSSKLSEPLGTTILEAMAHGKIVIASNTGGTPEIIENNEDGFMFTPGSVDDLTKVLKYVIDNYDSLDFVKQNAVKKIETQFSLHESVKKYLALTLNENS